MVWVLLASVACLSHASKHYPWSNSRMHFWGIWVTGMTTIQIHLMNVLCERQKEREALTLPRTCPALSSKDTSSSKLRFCWSFNQGQDPKIVLSLRPNERKDIPGWKNTLWNQHIESVDSVKQAETILAGNQDISVQLPFLEGVQYCKPTNNARNLRPKRTKSSTASED